MSDRIQILEETIEMEVLQVTKQESPNAKRRSSSISYVPSRTPSPTPSMMVEAPDIPPPTPPKAEAELEQIQLVKITPVSHRGNFASRRSQVSSTSPEDSVIFEIRFARPSDEEETFSSSASSDSSSSTSGSFSIGSDASATRMPGVRVAANPRNSDVDLTLQDGEDGYAYAIMAALESPAETEADSRKVPYSDTYIPQQEYEPSRCARSRGRSRGHQPYPQPSTRDHASRRRSKFQVHRRRPELKVT